MGKSHRTMATWTKKSICSEREETELKDNDSSLNQPQEKGDQEKESSELFGTQ